jgi:hypothetical protein
MSAIRPSGLNLTPFPNQASSEFAGRGGQTFSPERAFHIVVTNRSPPERTWLPSGLNLRVAHQPSLFSNGGVTDLPVAASHTCAVRAEVRMYSPIHRPD